MVKPFEIIKTERVFESKYINLNKDVFLNQKGDEHEYFYEDANDCVHALGIDKNNNFVLVQEYRIPVKQTVIQVVGGKMDKEGESPEDCALRELMEEAGYEGGKVVSLGKTAINTSRANNYIYEFLIFDCEKVSEDYSGEPSEVTEPFILPVNEAWEYIKNDKIAACHSTSTIVKALLYLGIMPNNLHN